MRPNAFRRPNAFPGAVTIDVDFGISLRIGGQYGQSIGFGRLDFKPRAIGSFAIRG